ncbi:MAG: beta-ketoacyl-[acyl-carrier-protein] synthase family protein [Thermodesulfovibrionales bacterium]
MRVVITGIGILSPIGIGRDSFWQSLINGRNGFKKITLFDTSSFKVNIGGEIEFDPAEFLGKKGLRDLDRSTRLVCSAARLAIDDSGLVIDEETTYTTGVSIGTTFGSLHSISQFDRVGLIEGPRFVNPSHFPNTVINSPASQISIRFNIKGFNTTISTGFCSSLDAVSYGTDFIRMKRAKAVLTGGVEELCEETFMGFHILGCLSGLDGSEPLCCPFDRRRNGVILSEGAGVIVIEEEENALRRGANILSVVKGYGNAFDPDAEIGFTHNGKGLAKAIRIALSDASLSPEDIDCVISCANSTRGLDRLETQALKEALSGRAYEIPVTSIKSMVGETYSASGILSLSAAVEILQKNMIPATLNFEEKDPECDLNYIHTSPIEAQIRNILITAADPYGQNSAIIIGKD